MHGQRRLIRQLALGAALVVVVGGGFVAGRTTRPAGGPPDPVKLEHGVPVGVIDSRAGALAAADNFFATGLAASVDPGEFHRVLNAVIDPAARGAFVVDNPDPGSGPPHGARVIGMVVGHRLESFGEGSATVSLWVLATYWGAGAVPTQYWSLDQLSLRWRGDQWWILAGRDSLPGPIPAQISGGRAARSNAVWDGVLAGMSVPYYGAS